MTTQSTEEVTGSYALRTPYQAWMDSVGIPIHGGYYLEDLRTIAVGSWNAREVDAAFIELEGQQGVTGGYVTEIPPGKTIPFWGSAMDEALYILSGRGVTTVKSHDGSQTRSVEWQTHSMMVVPGNYLYQITNMQGNVPARILHFSYTPLVMNVAREPNMVFDYNNPSEKGIDLNRFYAETKAVKRAGLRGRESGVWSGNFFPDMRMWDSLEGQTGRGGSLGVSMEHPGSTIRSHMMVIRPTTYKKAHRHGAGFMIVVPGGEGYSIMWPGRPSENEGREPEKVVCPWHEGSVFVPPNRWFHQHFSLGDIAGRCYAIHPPRFLDGVAETVEDAIRDQIEYPDEDPWLRQKFEADLAAKGLKSGMPEEAYKDPNYKWDYSWTDPGLLH